MKKNRRLTLLLVFLLVFSVGGLNAQMNCEQNVVGALSANGNSDATVKIFAQSLVENYQDYTDLEVSRDDITYGSSITFDCGDIGNNVFYARGTKNGVLESCSDELMIQDNTLPILITNDEAFTYVNTPITIDQIDNGSFDNCGIATSTLSQDTWSSLGTFTTNYTLTDIGGNVITQGVDVDVVNSVIACNTNVQATLDENGIFVLESEVITEGGPYAPNIEVYNLETGEGGETLELDCDDLGTFMVQVLDPNNENSCWGWFTLADMIAPTPYAQNVTVSMNGGTSATITPELVDAGSFDNCSIESVALSQSTFTAPGTYDVTFTVTDQSGNSDFADVSVTVLEGTPGCNGAVNISLAFMGEATVDGEVFVEGNADYDVIEVSRDNINFDETVTFNCDDHGTTSTVYVRIEQDGNQYNCTSEATIEDKLAPIAIVQNFTIDLASETDTYTLTPDDIDIGSTDNCANFTFTLSQTEFSSDDWGYTDVVLIITDVAGLTAFAVSTITVLIDGELPPIQCLPELTTNALPWGGPEVFADDFVLNSDDFDEVLISTDPMGPFTESFVADCGVNGNSTSTLYIQATSGTEEYNCSSELTVVDNIAPVAIGEVSVTLVLVDGEAELTPEMVDDGSYDSCTDITLSLDKTLFTAEDIGNNTVILTVTDLNGNYNEVWTIVYVEGENSEGCSLGNVIFPEDIEINDENGILDNLTIENLQEIYGYTYEEVHPFTATECDGLAYSYSDQFIYLSYGVKVIRSWTALDWYTGEVASYVQLLKLYTDFSTSLACNDLGTVSIENGPVTLWPQDVLEGGPYNYDNMVLEIEDGNGDAVEDNLITDEYLGQTLIYTVTDITTENSCFGNIEVVNYSWGCPLDGEDIVYPLPAIQLTDFNLDPSTLTPQYLADNYGFTLAEVSVTWPEEDCLVAAYTYEDTYFTYSDGSIKIVRNFTVVDWMTYNPGSSAGIWTFTQVITAGIDPSSLICDFLPNTADFGDCESGHTDTDDVEWPADLAIADYRIAPEELVEYSMVEIENSKPIFFNSPDDYEATYVDLLVELGQSSLIIGRVWTVNHLVYGFSWTYTQTINVDFSEFDNLVTVNTGTNRAMPGVTINDVYTTNMQGLTYVEESEDVVATYEDSFLNGVSLLDLILIQRHILGIEKLPDFGIIAADINKDNAIKASDLIMLRKILLGAIDPPNGPEWNFYNRELEGPVNVEPKAALLGIKTGDVDDSAILFGEEEFEPEDNFVIVDELLNKGETYSIPVFLENEYSILGVDYRIKLDTNLLQIEDVSSVHFGVSPSSYKIKNGELRISVSTANEVIEVGGNLTDPVFYIEVVAKENSLLSLAFDSEDILSFVVTSELESLVLGSRIGEVIGTGTNSEELAGLSIYPNPTSEYLNFDLNTLGLIGETSISIFESTGRMLLNQKNSDRVDVSQLNPGMYYYHIKVGEYATTGKFMVVR